MHLMSVIIIKRGQIPGNLKLDWDQDLLITLTSASFFDERRIYLRQMSVCQYTATSSPPIYVIPR